MSCVVLIVSCVLVADKRPWRVLVYTRRLQFQFRLFVTSLEFPGNLLDCTLKGPDSLDSRNTLKGPLFGHPRRIIIFCVHIDKHIMYMYMCSCCCCCRWLPTTTRFSLRRDKGDHLRLAGSGPGVIEQVQAGGQEAQSGG